MSDQPGTPDADQATGTDDGRCGSNAPGCDGHGGCGGNNGCGGHSHDAPTIPVLDARQIDPLIRQSAIFGVLIGLPPNAAVTVITDTDPTPMAELLEERMPGEYEALTDKAPDQPYQVTFFRH